MCNFNAIIREREKGKGKSTILGKIDREKKRHLQRLEELRRDLYYKNSIRKIYSAETLLSQIWIKLGSEEYEAACALFNYSPSLIETKAPPIARRFCQSLEQSSNQENPQTAISSSKIVSMDWRGEA